MDRLRKLVTRQTRMLGLVAIGAMALGSLMLSASTLAESSPRWAVATAALIGASGLTMLGLVTLAELAAARSEIRSLSETTERLTRQVRKVSQELQGVTPRRAWSELDPTNPSMALADLALEINDDLARIVENDRHRTAAILTDLWTRIEAAENRIIAALDQPAIDDEA